MAKAKKKKVRTGVTDFHVHIQPWEQFRPDALEKMKARRPDFEEIVEMSRSPAHFLSHLDVCGVERAVLINYVSPDVIGFTAEVNEWIANYCRTAPDRLLAVGSVHPRLALDPGTEMDVLCGDLGIRMIKIHPPHQLMFANAYREGLNALGVIYRKAQEYRIPVMIHTGTSIFPKARSKYGDPMYCDDVGVDFPDLQIVLAHGGRPLWMKETFFLLRRHPNFYLDISSIPPQSLLDYFPRLEEIADKVVFGTDWPGPMVPGIQQNLAAVERLRISAKAKQKILVENARKLLP